MARETAGNGVDTQEVADGIYMVDTLMLGHEGHTATFIVTDEDETAVVETGLSNDVDRILGGLSSLGIAPEEVDYVLITHAHLDHAGGAGYLADECGNATLVCHERAVEYLSDPDKVEKLVESVRRAVGELGDDYGDAKPVDRERFETVSGGETLDVAGHSFEVVEATGHAPHQFCVYDGTTGGLFTADEAGMYLHGNLHPTTPPPNFDLERNLESLDQLAEYDPEFLLYTHYGRRDDAVEALREYDRLLRAWVDEVERVRRREENDEDVVEEFVGRDHVYYDVWDETSARETIRMDVEGVLLYLDG